jgi:membrane-associated phospholipid phosphatase
VCARRHVVALVLGSAITLLTGMRAYAQATPRVLGRELGEVANDVGFILRSPLRAGREDWLSALAVTGGFAALSSVDGSVDRWIAAHPRALALDAVKPFRESNRVFSKLVTGWGLIPISAGLITAGMLRDDRALRDAGVGCFTGWAVSNVVRYTVYASVGRLRPSVAGGDPYGFAVPGGADWNAHSFPAGHATNAFACSTFWNERFELGFAEPALYAVATATALARMADRRHWTSDTFFGAVMGYAVGRSLARRSEHRVAQRRVRSGARGVSPDVVLIVWRSKF